MAIIVYAPTLALKQGIEKGFYSIHFRAKFNENLFSIYYVVTGINVYLSVGIMLSVCTFYTALVNP
jgi:hypothetical protein